MKKPLCMSKHLQTDSHWPLPIFVEHHEVPYHKWYILEIYAACQVADIFLAPLSLHPVPSISHPSTEQLELSAFFCFLIIRKWNYINTYMNKKKNPWCTKDNCLNYDLPVSCIIFKLSRRLSSYTRVPPISFSKSRRSESFIKVKDAIYEVLQETKKIVKMWSKKGIHMNFNKIKTITIKVNYHTFPCCTT